MTELPPDVRDRAAEAAREAGTLTGMFTPEQYWGNVVDAVAEVLAAEQSKPDDQLAALEAEFPEQAPMLRQAMKDAPAVILRLWARVDELEGALAEDDKLLRFAVDRGLLSQHVDTLIAERDALKARVAELEGALRLTSALVGDGEDARDALQIVSSAEIAALKARVDLLTTALTEIGDSVCCGVWTGVAVTNCADSGREELCAVCIARAVLAATPTGDSIRDAQNWPREPAAPKVTHEEVFGATTTESEA
jgi:hypothetical protein